MSTSATRSTAVLGGGVLGLTAALKLLQAGHEVTVFERETLPGGLAAGFQVAENVWLEKFYHHLFRTDSAIVALFDELDRGGTIKWTRPVTSTRVGSRSFQLDSAQTLLRFSPLTPWERVRMGAVLAVLKTLPSASLLEGHTAAGWLQRSMGRRAFETAWKPLLLGKFGDHWADVSMPWFWARIHDRTPELGYPVGGFQLFYDALAERIRSLGGSIRLGTEVARIRPDGGRITIEHRPVVPTGEAGASRQPDAEVFNCVISTLPTRVTCALTDGMPEAFVARHGREVAYAARCLVLSLRHGITDSYWISLTDPAGQFMAVVEHTNMIPAEHYGGRHLVYLGSYLLPSDPRLSLPQEQLIDDGCALLADLNPEFSPEWVEEAWLFTAPNAQPLVTASYAARIPPFRTPIDGLLLANMFQVYPHDRGQNYSVRLATDVVHEVLS